MMRALQLAVLMTFFSTALAQNPHIYNIQASGCTGAIKARSQTGFRIFGTRGIVTALHGVIGCGSIRARSDGGLVLYDPLQIGMVDIDDDAALLVSNELNANPPDGLRLEDDASYAASSKVTVQGHPFGIMALSTTFSLRNPPVVPLRNLVPDDVLDRLNDRNSPNPLIQVLSLESGNLLPGHSGAPVFNTRGLVIGVADGGLKGGTVQISWAIPYGQIRWVRPPSNQRFQSLQKTSDIELFQYEGDEEGPDLAPDDTELKREGEEFKNAVEKGDIETVRRFIPQVTPEGKSWALSKLAVNNGPDGMVWLLLDNGADVNAALKDLAPPLFLAVSAKQVSVVRILAEQEGLNINAVRTAKNLLGATIDHTVLQDAINDCHERLDILKILVAVPGIDPNVRGFSGETPIQKVVDCNWEEAVDLLLKVPGLEINALNSRGESALDLTYSTCRTNAAGCRIADKLLKAGAKPFEYTPAEFAANLADSKRDHRLQ